ncbi:MAG: nucleotidyltransferase family protein [Lachnospiraceae bacterium]|nr:nucleotidyltransferase family protein [Lachnospiraceae bacterium]
MITTAIITEYNPLHNGHKYQIEKAKELTSCDNMIIAMSGNYVQRGEPAIFNKYTRSKWAINAGCDLVMELPTVFSTGSAELFACSAVDLLNKTGIVNYLVFGCEEDSIDKLKEYAQIFTEEPQAYKEALKNYLKDGCSFPKARSLAVAEYTNDSDSSAILNKPNNILAVEYLKALIKSNSSITPIGIKRNDNGYNSSEIAGRFASATATRKLIQAGDTEALKYVVPDFVFKDIKDNSTAITNDNFSDLYFYSLIRENRFDKYSDISKFLSNKLNNEKNNFRDINSFLNQLLTKDETLAHLKRSLLHILLGITEDIVNSAKASGYNQYIFPLAINSGNSILLKSIKSNCQVPFVNKYGDFYKSATTEALRLLEINYKADLLYNQKAGYNIDSRFDDFTLNFKSKIH